MSAIITRPTPPTSSLPPLARLSSYSTDDIDQALQNLQAIYATPPLPSLPSPAKSLPKHLIHDTTVPDSGYASEEDTGPADCDNDAGGEEAFDLDVLRSDTFEREHAVRWLTAFAARSDAWVCALPAEEDTRAALVDAAASLLASFSAADSDSCDSPDDGLTREFTFPSAGGAVTVVLNDAPLSTTDHTSVGLQSWGSAIVFAERMCASPRTFSLDRAALPDPARGIRVLELGAGTGLLSLAAAKLLARSAPPPCIVATDYHPSVLANLRANVATNFPAAPGAVHVHALDWQAPAPGAPPLDAPFDVVLAADVVYHPAHAAWIKACVARVLRRPAPARRDAGGVFWLIIPVRATGRHAGMGATVEAVFPTRASGEDGEELVIRSAESIGKHSGIGRADEGGYTLFEIGWASA